MSLRVYAWDANPAVSPFLYRQSNNRAQEIVASGRGELIRLPDGRSAVQLRATQKEAAEKAVGWLALVPFGRGPLGKVMHPPSLNYPIPFVGALRLANYCIKINHVPEAVA